MEKRSYNGILTVEVRQLEDGRRVIAGRAVPYGQLSTDMGGWREVIDKPAFDIAGDIRALWQHDSSQVLGRSTVGTLRMAEGDDGIYVEIDPPDTQWARDALISIERGDVSGFSFGFISRRDRWDSNVRHVLLGDLLEVSVVSWPAYETTAEVLMRAADLAKQAGQSADDTTGDADLGAQAGVSDDDAQGDARARADLLRRVRARQLLSEV